MENVIESYKGNFKEDFLYAFYHKNKYIISSQILEDFSKKYKAVYEKYLINHKVQEMISIREENISPNQEEVLFLKTIENVMSKNYLEYFYVRIRNISPLKIKFVVYLCVG